MEQQLDLHPEIPPPPPGRDTQPCPPPWTSRVLAEMAEAEAVLDAETTDPELWP